MPWKTFLKSLIVCLTLLFSTSILADLILAEGKPTGQWYDPARSGEGFFVEIVNTGGHHQISVAMFSFDNDGNQLWAAGNVAIEGDQQIVDIPLLRFDGPMWGPAFDPADLNTAAFATLTARFTSCDSAYFSIVTENPGEFQSGNYSLVRLTDIEGIDCGDSPPVPDQIESGKWTGPGQVCLQVNEDGTAVVEEGSTCDNGTSFASFKPGIDGNGGNCTVNALCEGTSPIVDGKFICSADGQVVGYFTSDTTVVGIAVSPIGGLGNDVCTTTWTATPE